MKEGKGGVGTRERESEEVGGPDHTACLLGALGWRVRTWRPYTQSFRGTWLPSWPATCLLSSWVDMLLALKGQLCSSPLSPPPQWRSQRRVSQQALAPGTDSPSHRAVIHLQQCHFPSIWPPGLSRWGWGTRVLGWTLQSPGSSLEGGLCHSHKPTSFVTSVTGKKSPVLALQECKRRPKQ